MRPNARDEADIAAEQEEISRNEALRQQQLRAAKAKKATGKCGNCDEPSTGAFCDADCRKDWERRQRK